MLTGALVGAGALSAQHTGAHEAKPSAAKTPAAKAGWKALLFDEHQTATVATLAELIIPRTDTPGAKDARVHEFIDLILHDGALERRTRFLEGLNWLDGYALREHQLPFVKCTPAQQTAMLTAFEKGGDASLEPGTQFFRAMKGLTVQGYYTSREGIAELNKGGRVPPTFSGHKEGDH